MPKLKWDQTGQRLYETGVDHGVLYVMGTEGYGKGVAWNGLISVSENPTGAESNKQYADNIAYLNLISNEEFGATIEAFTYPPEFEPCDGLAEISKGVYIGQQPRKQFGLAYRTLIGNDVDGQDYGYKIHLVYGALATPSERSYGSVNDSPEAINFSWELSTTPVEVPDHRPTANIVIDSTKVDKDKLKELEDKLFGTDGTGEGATGTDPTLPSPAEVFSLFNDAAG